MNQMSFVIAAYAVGVPAIVALVAHSYWAMQRAEAALQKRDREEP